MGLKSVSPGAELDYVWPWGTDGWLDEGETIAEFELLPVGGVEVVAGSGERINSNRDIKAKLRFPTLHGQRCWVDCEITSSVNARKDRRRFAFVVMSLPPG